MTTRERVRCGDGLAVDANLVHAAERAVAEALVAMDDIVPDLAVIFACGPEPDDVTSALTRAAELSGARTVLGCNAPGVIGAGQGIELTSSVSVWLGRLPGVTVRSFHLEVLRTSEAIAVVGMPPMATTDMESDRTVAVLLADPYSFPVDAFVARGSR